MRTNNRFSGPKFLRSTNLKIPFVPLFFNGIGPQTQETLGTTCVPEHCALHQPVPGSSGGLLLGVPRRPFSFKDHGSSSNPCIPRILLTPVSRLISTGKSGPWGRETILGLREDSQGPRAPNRSHALWVRKVTAVMERSSVLMVT
jgi:hypothetical protein